ncbi:MAG: hypothetical protein ABI035_03745 [Gemmatimonadaceae bacterium]
MPVVKLRPVAALAGFALAIGALVACTTSRDSNDTLTKLLADAKADAPSSGSDPCTLLSAAELEPYVGALATPPYRADDGRASTTGDQCIYRGKDGRVVSIAARTGGAVAGQAMQDIPDKLGAALNKGGASGMGSMVNEVMKKEVVAGPWDKATWIPGGALFITKGDNSVQVDMTGASGKEADALALGKIAVPRIDHPLSYNGAKAVALVPKPPAHPKNPCDVISRAEAVAALGPLSGNPVADSDGTACTYTVASPNGTRNYPIGYTWEDGDRGYNMLKHSMATVSGMLHVPGGSVLDTMKPTGQVGTMMTGLMKMVSGGSATTAPGAVATVGLQTDTTLKGPWDQAMLMHGTQLLAVHHDVMMTIDLRSADYEHAKALLATASKHF